MIARALSSKRTFLRRPQRPPHLFTLIVLAGTGVVAMNIFLPMLPDIARELNTTNAMAQYVLTLFLGTTALVQLFVGPLADRFGRRPVLLVMMSCFLLGTIICTFATSIEMLLFGRVLQSSAAAGIALSRAIVRDLYERAKAASMIGYVTMAMAVMPMVTPSIGGLVGESFGWRGPFAITLIVAVAVLLLVYFDLGETHAPSLRSAGDQVRDYLALLREPEVWGYFITASLASGAYFAFLGGAPFISEKIIGLTPAQMGAWFATVAVGYMFGNFLSGRHSESVGIERMMLLGGIISSLGVAGSLALMTLLAPHAAFLFVPMAAVGMGNGMTLPNANAGAISVRPDLAGSASGLGGFLQIGGGALLAALAGILISTENAGMPLYIIMFLSSVLAAILSALMFLRRRRIDARATSIASQG